MSYEDGWAAINLQMPSRVPRTEYSAASHWELVSAVIGREVGPESSEEEKQRCAEQFIKAWNYDFMWRTNVSSNDLSEMRTDMGHAVYAAGGTDFRTEIHCPFKEPEDVLAFDPWEVYGQKDRSELRQRFEDGYKAQRARFPECVCMSGIYITLVSGLIDIFGWDMLLMAAGIDPDGFGEVANRYASWIQQYYDALAEADVPLVMSHDDIVWTAGAIFPPDWYRKYVFPNYRKYYAPLLDSGKKIAYTSDGNYTEFIDDIVATGVHGFVLEPLTDMKYIAEKYGRTHFFIGNADTRILLSGSREQIRAEVQRCMDIGKSCPGFFMAVGNHIPSNTPVGNALYYNEVYEEMSRR